MTTDTIETRKGQEAAEATERGREVEASTESFTDFRERDARSPWPEGPVVLCLGTSRAMQYAMGRGVRAGGAIPVFYDQFEHWSNGDAETPHLGLGKRPDLTGLQPGTEGAIDTQALCQYATARAAARLNRGPDGAGLYLDRDVGDAQAAEWNVQDARRRRELLLSQSADETEAQARDRVWGKAAGIVNLHETVDQNRQRLLDYDSALLTGMRIAAGADQGKAFALVAGVMAYRTMQAKKLPEDVTIDGGALRAIAQLVDAVSIVRYIMGVDGEDPAGAITPEWEFSFVRAWVNAVRWTLLQNEGTGQKNIVVLSRTVEPERSNRDGQGWYRIPDEIQRARARAAYGSGAVMGIWEHPLSLLEDAERHARIIAEEAVKVWESQRPKPEPKPETEDTMHDIHTDLETLAGELTSIVERVREWRGSPLSIADIKL
jgi:hypothetical protein